jgi:hypothetical protein
MPEITNQTFDPDYSRALDIESLISAPLVAVSKANVTMAQGQTRFLLDYCFNKTDDGYEPVMIKMALTRHLLSSEKHDNTVEAVTTYFHLPLLTIVPLNSLAVDKVTLDFHLEISGTGGKDGDKTPGAGNQITDKKAQLYGKISSDPAGAKSGTSRQNKSKIAVNINASALPLPSGVLTIIDMYNRSIHASPNSNE